jgi:hypothetical protein
MSTQALNTTLAKSGTEVVVIIAAVILGGIVLGVLLYVLYDYHRHKKPLVEADPNTHYTLSHHIRLVTLPLLRYRLQLKFKKKTQPIITHHQ